MRTSFQYATFFLTLFGFVSLGWIVQNHILFNWDVSWLLHAAKRMLAGGTYTKDFFELNPPLILYIYTPALLLQKMLSLSLITALRLYICVLGAISLFLCDSLIRKLFSSSDKTLAIAFLIAIATTYFIFPIEQFGQREHLLLLMTLPYLLAIPYRLYDNKLDRSKAIMIGLLAGLGFALKPYFLMTLILIELYYAIQKRDLFAWIRTEVITMMLIFALYLIVILLRHQDYLLLVIPLAARLYYTGVSQPLAKLAANPAVFSCYIAGFFYFWQFNKPTYKPLRTVLFITLLGFLFAYFFQQTTWYSHLFPAFTIAFLLLVLEFALFACAPKLTRTDSIFVVTTIIFIGGLITYYHTPLRVILIFQPLNFFCYFAFWFAAVFYMAESHRNFLKSLGELCIIIGVSYLFTNVLLQSNGFPYRFLLTNCMLILLFILLAPRTKISRQHATAIAMLGIIAFSYTGYYMSYLYSSSLIKKEKMSAFIHFLDTYAHNKPVDFFASTSFYTYPSVDYVNATPSSRFQFLGWVADLLKKEHLPDKNNSALIKDKNNLMAMLVEDLNTKKPAFVFVDTWPHKENIDNSQFDFVNYFLQDAKFQTAWQAYRYFATIDDPTMYKFIVYKRVAIE